MLEVVDLCADHVREIAAQPSQAMQLGVPIARISDDEAEDLASQQTTAAFLRDGRVIGVMGVAETFPGTHGVAWAIFAEGLGADHLAITREARRRLDTSPLARIEAIAPAADAEPLMALLPDIDASVLTAALSSPQALTPEIRWAMMMGFQPVHVLRKYGMGCETHMLLERIA
ncbi:hypothetical protein GCM10010990_24380 [Croceicoccus mobilis]|uniref:Uncharacterized protein n=2 Tax=Croceicoccus mobilis TaxID=1703339 RepID=A0A916Z2M8_9SPHN|nr:hypothetical protein GCM10010990_24380 [Croceicoccus mobilis]